MLFKGSQNWKHLKVFHLSPLVFTWCDKYPTFAPTQPSKAFWKRGNDVFCPHWKWKPDTVFLFSSFALYTPATFAKWEAFDVDGRILLNSPMVWNIGHGGVDPIGAPLLHRLLHLLHFLSLVQVDQIKGCIRPERNFPSSPSASKAPPPLLRI